MPTQARQNKHRLLMGLILFFTACVLLIPLSSQTLAQPVKPVAPVILIPGIMGSQLSDDKGVVWGDVTNTIRRFEDLELHLEKDKNRISPSGILDKVQVFGPFQIGIYKSLITKLEELGFKQNENLFIFPYDWRKSALDSAVQLKDFISRIKKQYSIGDKVKFNLVAHSMGGIVARLYILRYEGNTEVSRLITLGTPHFGSLDALYTLRFGLGDFKNWVVGGEQTVKKVLFSYPGLIELLPTYTGCCYLGPPQKRERLDILDVSLWKNLHWIPPYVADDPARLDFLTTAFKSAREIRELMNKNLPGDVTHIQVVGDNIDTRGQVYVNRGDGVPIKWILWNGDGTVVTSSAGTGDPRSQSATQKHASIFKDQHVASALKFALTIRDTTEPFAFQPTSSYVEVDSKLVEVKSFNVQLKETYYQLGSQATVLVTITAPNGEPVKGVKLKGWILPGGQDTGASDPTEPESQTVPLSFLEGPRDYRGEFQVPLVEDSYKVVVSIPGLGSLEDYFAAIAAPAK